MERGQAEGHHHPSIGSGRDIYKSCAPFQHWDEATSMLEEDRTVR